MSDYNEDNEIFFQELDAFKERIKSGNLSKLDFKRMAYLVELYMYIKEGREDKLEELELRMKKDFGCQ